MDKQPWEVFDEEIFPYLSFEKLFGDLPALKQKGNFWQACCPIHGREAPNAFSIDPQSLEWNCHLGCGGGGPVQYLQLVQGLAWMEAAGEAALLAGIDAAVLDPWRGRWTEEDFQRHRELEQRSSLLGILISHAQSVFLSSAGETVRHFLVRRRGFPEARLEDLGLGLYSSPEDMWHYLKESKRDLGELQERGFFDARWAGRILGAWKDLHGRTVNLWGWQPWITAVGTPRWGGSILLFDDRDPLGATRMPFLLHLAARLEKRDLALIEGPVKALLAYCLGLENPFPVAAAGELTMPQIRSLQNYFHDDGSLTLCWDYDPETYGTAKERTVRTLKLLTEVRFPVYVVDPRLLTGNGKVKKKVSVDEFILAQGGGEKGIDGFQRILEKRRAETSPQTTVLLGKAWPELSEVFRGSSHAKVGILESIFGAAEEIGQRIAQGFLGALPQGLVRGLSHASGEEREGLAGEIRELPAPPVNPPPAFSVERLEEEDRKASRGKLSGWGAVDWIGVSFNPGELVVVGGRPGHGKTSFLIGLLVEWLSQADRSGSEELFLFYAMEESEVRIYHRLLSLLTGREGRGWTPNEVRAYLRDSSPLQFGAGVLDHEVLRRSRECLRRWEGRLHIVHRPSWTITEMEAHTRDLAAGHPVGAILVDTLQRVPPPRRTRGRRDLQVSAVAAHLKALAEELSCPVVATAEIGRQAVRSARKIPSDRSFQDEAVRKIIRMRRPQLHHLKEGGSEEEAVLVLGLLNYAMDYRAELGQTVEVPTEAPLEVGTLKNRYGPVGLWSTLLLEGRFGLLRDPPP